MFQNQHPTQFMTIIYMEIAMRKYRNYLILYWNHMAGTGQEAGLIIRVYLTIQFQIQTAICLVILPPRDPPPAPCTRPEHPEC